MEPMEATFGVPLQRGSPLKTLPTQPVGSDFHHLQQQAREVNARLETAVGKVEDLIARIYGEGETSDAALKAHPHAAGALGELHDCLNRAEVSLERMERKLERLSQLA